MQNETPLLDRAAGLSATPIHLVRPDDVDQLTASLSAAQQTWLKAQGFDAKPGQLTALPAPDGAVAAYVFGRGPADDVEGPMQTGALPGQLPAEIYRFVVPGEADLTLETLAFGLGSYRFDRYRSNSVEPPRLLVDDGVDAAAVRRQVEAIRLTRDLINTPANDMGPADLEAAIRVLGGQFDAAVSATVGSALLDNNFPMIHAVGRAADQAPRLVDLVWGRTDAPKVTLVGKGVCFDTGGLDIKPPSSMSLMKKDMGGAANVLGLAQMVMAAGLDVRLRVLIPAVENSISSSAFRPGDILPSRSGKTVEIGNTDAEGRLVLADALTLACEEQPDLLVDMATLTGAARVALGPDLPPFYTTNDKLADELMARGQALVDPLWRMPLWSPYRKMLTSKAADINHISPGPFAGSITAALFLQTFVDDPSRWLHFDIFGWTPKPKPGHPEGGAAMAIRTLFDHLQDRYSGR